MEWADGSKAWYVNGLPHRLDGPAIERANGYKEWWVDGKRHRLDGPAVEYANGRIEFWEYGVQKFRRSIYDSFEVSCE